MGGSDSITWLCILGIIAAGIANLRHTTSSLILQQDFREQLPKEQADRYQSLVGAAYIGAGVIAAAAELWAEGALFAAGMAAAILVLVGGTMACNRKYLPRKAKK